MIEDSETIQWAILGGCTLFGLFFDMARYNIMVEKSKKKA